MIVNADISGDSGDSGDKDEVRMIGQEGCYYLEIGNNVELNLTKKELNRLSTALIEFSPNGK